MSMCFNREKKGAAKYRVLPLFVLTLLLFTDAFGSQKIYQDGHYRVRQTGETCKLEIFLESNSLVRSDSKFWKYGFNNDTIGFLSVFKTDDYFGELITERSRVGLAKSKFTVKFDGKVDNSVMASESIGKDDLWRWRHFSYHNDMLNRIKRSRKMEVEFSNGKNLFHFEISLKGSSKAIRFLKNCRGR